MYKNYSCCVVNCENKGVKNGCKMYRFPTAKHKIIQRNKWIAAVQRKNPDGSEWHPRPFDRICTAHFIGNKKSEEELSPSYVPTIFSPVDEATVRSKTQAMKRHDRFMNRRIVKREPLVMKGLQRATKDLSVLETDNENTMTNSSGLLQSSIEKETCDQGCQADRKGRHTQLRGTAVPTQNLPTTKSTPDERNAIEQVIMEQETILDPLDCGNYSELEYTSEQMILTQDEINSQLINIPIKHEMMEYNDMNNVEDTYILNPLDHCALEDTTHQIKSTHNENNSQSVSMETYIPTKQEIIYGNNMVKVKNTNIQHPLVHCRLDTTQQIKSIQDEINSQNASAKKNIPSKQVIVEDIFQVENTNILHPLVHCTLVDTAKQTKSIQEINLQNVSVKKNIPIKQKIIENFDTNTLHTLVHCTVKDTAQQIKSTQDEINSHNGSMKKHIAVKQEIIEDIDMFIAEDTKILYPLVHCTLVNNSNKTKSINDEINILNDSVNKNNGMKKKIIEDIEMVQLEDTNKLQPLVHCTKKDTTQHIKSNLDDILLRYAERKLYEIEQNIIEDETNMSDPLDSTNNFKTIYTAEQIKSIRDEIDQSSSTDLANPNELDVTESNQELYELKLMIARAEAEIDSIVPQKVLTDSDQIFFEHSYFIKSQKNYISCNACCGSFDSYKRLNEHNRKWTCTKCNTSFQASCEYIDHKLVCYRCDECSRHFSRLPDYKSHTQLKRVVCRDCKVLCNSLCLLRKHELDNHGQVQKCIYCFSIYDKTAENYHSAGCITCDKCCKTFLSQCLLMIHLNYCLPCKHCNFIIKHAQYMHKHVENKTHNCCNESFVSLCKLNQHMHQPDCKRSELLDKVQYACTICMKLFKTVLKLKFHSWEHVGNQCDICKKRFYSLNLLNKHIKQSSCSTNNGKCKCLICGARFTSTDDLQKHIIVHSDENPLICDLCGEGFESEKTLNFHKKDHMNTKKGFRCNVCKNKFSTAKSFEYHVCSKTKTSIFNNCSNNYEQSFTNSCKLVLDNEAKRKQIRCRVCRKEFKKMSSLVSHMRLHP